jgi:hypothetical protein
MTGQGIDTPYASHIDVDVRDIAADGGKSVYLDMFEGADHRSLGPIAAREQNPMVLAFLQRDVTRMAKLTGGAAVYYQQQVPRAFTQAAESEPFEVGLGDRKLPGLRLVIKPLANEPHIGRFPQYRDKTYEFVVADGIPGGIYRVASRTPDPKDGHVILEETVTFKGATP